MAMGTFCFSQAMGALPENSVTELSALPDTNAAANFVTNLATSALPVVENPTLKNRLAVSLIEVGFMVGTTTAVHELGHARQVRALGGESRWETGDNNWWMYFSHRVPLASGETTWRLPRIATSDELLRIATGGFNATTAWDEAMAGRGPCGLLAARYSTLFYEFAGVRSSDDDLSQIEHLYATKGYKITRREMQVCQLLTGVFTQTNGSVRAYTYFTPRGVSLKAMTQWRDWSVAAEAIVHGTSDTEVEFGRRIRLGRSSELQPKILVSSRGIGGSLQAGIRMRATVISMDCQLVNPATLLGTRAITNLDLTVATPL